MLTDPGLSVNRESYRVPGYRITELQNLWTGRGVGVRIMTLFELQFALRDAEIIVAENTKARIRMDSGVVFLLIMSVA